MFVSSFSYFLFVYVQCKCVCVFALNVQLIFVVFPITTWNLMCFVWKTFIALTSSLPLLPLTHQMHFIQSILIKKITTSVYIPFTITKNRKHRWKKQRISALHSKDSKGRHLTTCLGTWTFQCSAHSCRHKRILYTIKLNVLKRIRIVTTDTVHNLPIKYVCLETFFFVMDSI